MKKCKCNYISTAAIAQLFTITMSQLTRKHTNIIIFSVRHAFLHPPKTLFFEYHHQICLNNPRLSNVWLYAACWACFMCYHNLWATSMSHSFSPLNSSLGLAGGKHFQETTSSIFSPVRQNVALPDCFPYIVFYGFFSLHSSGWLGIAVCSFISVRKLVK